MFSLRLDGKECVSCGICMDVCHARSIAMRVHRSRIVEGECLSFLLGSNSRLEKGSKPLMAFPYLAYPESCDACGDCVEECPVGALQLLNKANGVATDIAVATDEASLARSLARSASPPSGGTGQ